MVKFPEAEARIIRNRFVCRKCKSVIKANNIAVLQKKVACRKCGSRELRPVRKK
jgi:ribosomal protein L40E